MMDAFAPHRLTSFTVTVYVPAAKPVAVAVVCPLLQLYVYGDVPPEALTVAVPLLAPLQLALVIDVATERADG